MTDRLSGKSCLVTGGTRGIGLAVAKNLSCCGARVIVTGTGPAPALPEAFGYRQVDFSDMSALSDFSREVSCLGVDILVNNAGINKISPLTEVDIEDFLKIQQVNVVAPFMLCQAVVPYMQKQQWGRIVNISSIWGKISKAKRSSYSASKFALDGITAAIAAELAQYGILANCVAPGVIDTSLTQEVLGADGIRDLSQQIPVGRLGTPEEIATFVAWLAGPENTYISGQNIAIDGGFTRV